MHKIDFTTKNLQQIVKDLRQGKVVILPTDTIYGFHCLANNQQAVQKIYTIKKRVETKPALLLIADRHMAMKYCQFSDLARHLCNHLWPGPVTFLLPRNKNYLSQYFPDFSSLAIRIPKSTLLQKIIHMCGSPLLSTSVNVSGQKSLDTEEGIIKQFSTQNVIFMKSQIENGKSKMASTILKINDTTLEVVREGAVSAQKINQIVAQFKGLQ